MDYNATATLRGRLTEAKTDSILDTLSAYGPAVNAAPDGLAEVVITFPAATLAQAVQTAVRVLDAFHPIALEVIPTDLWDKRAEAVPVPALLSVSEVAELLGVSRQAVLQRIESGSLPAIRIGTAWAIPAATVR